jgi:hypothetical protein
MKKPFISPDTLTRYLIGTICVLVIARIAIVPFSPPLFYIDESAGSAHVASMVTHGTNAYSQQWPLFSVALGGGYTTPIYLYPAVLWSFLFGYEPVSLRFFSEFMTLAAIVLIAYAVKLWTDKQTALITAVVALALPWNWLQGSLAWDPALVPFFVGVSFLAFSKILFTKSRACKYIGLVTLPVTLVLLAYLYPPLRVSAPLMFVGAYTLLYLRKIVGWKIIVATVIGSAVISLPLLNFLQDPDSLARSQSLLVFGKWPLFEAIGMFFINMLQFMTPWFNFINGDYNLRHSTGFQGMLGLAELPAYIALIVMMIKTWQKKWNDRLLVFVALYCVLAAFVGSALTYESQPHSLRATAAWPFIVILLALGWVWLRDHGTKRHIYTAITVFFVATVAYGFDLAFLYPARSDSSFDHPIYEKAIQHKPTPGYPDLSLKYYQSL